MLGFIEAVSIRYCSCSNLANGSIFGAVNEVHSPVQTKYQVHMLSGLTSVSEGRGENRGAGNIGQEIIKLHFVIDCHRFWLTSTTNCSENCVMSIMKTLPLSALQLSMNS